MIEQLKRKKGYLLALFIPYIIIMFMLTYRIDYTLTAPGGLAEVEEQVTFETMYETENRFYTTYVMSVAEPTFFQFMMATFDDGIDIREISIYEAGQTDKERIAYGHLQRDNAWNAAIISAYTALDIAIEYDIRMLVTRIYLDYAATDALNIMDEIISVNGETDNLINRINQVPCDEMLSIVVKDEAGTIKVIETMKQEVEGSCRLGITVEPYYDIESTDMAYTIDSNFVGGPSGGLMTFLHIYNTLTDVDVTTDLKIAGTGGISLDGRTRSMGAIKQKIITADQENVDIFFVPRLNDAYYYDNYQEAMRTLDTLDTDMIVVGVEYWTDAIDYLLALKDDD